MEYHPLFWTGRPVNRNLDALLAAAENSDWTNEPVTEKRHRFSVELDRRGLFLRAGRVEAYLCTETNWAWTFHREPGGLDAQVWRLHLITGRAPG
jgi:hypothetical protein